MSFDSFKAFSPEAGIESIDLTSHSVLAHFAKSTRNVQLLNFLLALDRVDRWAVDFDESGADRTLEIQLYIRDLEVFVESSMLVLHQVPQEFAEVLAHLTTSRCMYLIRFVGQRNEEFLERLSVLLENEHHQSPDICAVKRRLEAFHNATLLGEIFSGKRLTRIMKIMRSYADV